MKDFVILRIPKKKLTERHGGWGEKRVCFGDCPKSITCTYCPRNLIEYEVGLEEVAKDSQMQIDTLTDMLNHQIEKNKEQREENYRLRGLEE